MNNKKYFFLSVTSVILWAACFFYYYQSQRANSPASLTALVQKDIVQKQQEVASLINDKVAINNIWKDSMPLKQIQEQSAKSFIIQSYHNGKLIYWNSNTFPIDEYRYSSNWKAFTENGKVFVYRSIGNVAYPGKRINFIIPVFIHYDIQNEYLRSHFVASDLIPRTSQISFQQKIGATEIKGIDSRPLFYLSIKDAELSPFKPNIILRILLGFALLSTILSLQFLSIYLSKKYSPFLGVGLVVFLLSTAHLTRYLFGFPFGIQSLDIFSPLEYANNNFLASLGHLFLHVLSIYWVLALVLAQIKKAKKFDFLHLSKAKRWLILVVELGLIMLFCYYLQFLIKSIVYDSDISFDTNNFNTTSKYTIFSLIIIGFLARVMYLKLLITGLILSKTIRFNNVNYFIVFIILIGFNILYNILLGTNVFESNIHFALLDFFAVLWGVAFLYWLGYIKYPVNDTRKGLFSIIFIAVYFCLLFALFFKFYVDEKEKLVQRVSFAEELSRKQDPTFEIKYHDLSPQLLQDSVLRDWLQYSENLEYNVVLQYMRVHYTDLFYNNFNQELYLYDTNKIPIIEKQQLPLDTLVSKKNRSIAIFTNELFFRIGKEEQGAYLLFSPIYSPKHILLGYLAIDFKLKLNIDPSVFPKLLKDEPLSKKNFDLQYDYASYLGGQLITQSGYADFDYRIIDTLKIGDKFFANENGNSTLYYKVAENRVLAILYKNNVWLGVLTIFSFLFVILITITTIENSIDQISTGWLMDRKIGSFVNSRMSVRIKYFVLLFTATSFFVIGISTVFFLKNKYEHSSYAQIKSVTINLAESIREFYLNSIAESKTPKNQPFTNDKDLAYFLTNIAQQQKIDLNIFNKEGKLVFSTHENIFKTKLISTYLPYDVKLVLSQKKLASFLFSENVGKLSFTASYAPIFDRNGQLLAYLHVPFFYTKEQLDGQILLLITNLIDIYTILIILSSIITFFFVNSLTRSLSLIANGLKNVNLEKNESIHWPYKDEIGLLVSEYNKMLVTVEKTAKAMVIDERQNAWREMAQQVAHEIKNPLTPMKLNIQYLQQAINSNHPDIISLTKRVSNSIIEQIDNLNYIASEFSNFAKMPENKTERIDLKAMVENIILLFSGNKNLKISHKLPKESIIVFADKSQMLRIFTNIVQNAVEALPEHHMGVVAIEINILENKGMVEIKVIDNGLGIPEDVQAKIFEPYFTTKSSGTGLGLAMSKKIIELWGGSIRFESVLNKGTTFYLLIPMDK